MHEVLVSIAVVCGIAAVIYYVLSYSAINTTVLAREGVLEEEESILDYANAFPTSVPMAMKLWINTKRRARLDEKTAAHWLSYSIALGLVALAAGCMATSF